jgi:hypothetical protein
MKFPTSGALAALALAATIACSGGDSAPPVATVSFSANKTRVPLGSPIDLTYRFEVAPDAKIDGDYRVFVHFKGSTGRQFWDDDHLPPTPTSQWRPGQTIQYTRTRFIPPVPYIGEAHVEVGLYRDNPEGRLPLLGPNPEDRESTDRSYRVATLELLPQGENIFIIDKSGLHMPEFASDNTLEWKWTQKNAVMSFLNPRRDLRLYVEHDARPDLFPDKPQQVTIYVNDQPIATFAADSSVSKLERIPISAAQLGTNDMVELRLEVDRTFVPAKLPGGSADQRELGIRVYHIFLEPR